MMIGNAIFGTAVPGTFLLRHGKAPHFTSTDHAAAAWYECTRCGEFKAIRVGDVKPGRTVSCGCKGREGFIAHCKQRVSNLPRGTRKQMRRLARKGVPTGNIAKQFHLDKYVVSFTVQGQRGNAHA
ncbi:MAG: hypothetical protein ABSG62_14910 [Terracidiphilus sp.]|jgi:hypothetical protein